MKIELNGKYVALVVIGMLLLICFLFWRGCDSDPQLADTRIVDSLIVLHKQDSIDRTILQRQWSDSTMRLSTELAHSQIEGNKLGSRLDVSVQYSRRLAQELQDAKDLIEDTGMVAVSPKFVSAAIECKDQLLAQSAMVVAYKGAQEQQKDIYDQLLAIKDSALAYEQRSNIQERAEFNLMADITKRSVPRTKFFAGGKVFGSQQTVIGGAGFNGLLVTKGGKAWSVGTGMLNNGHQYFELGAHFLITFRKR